MTSSAQPGSAEVPTAGFSRKGNPYPSQQQ